jgi:hypothetical protein
VSLTALSHPDTVHVDGRTLAAPQGGRLIAFRLGRWDCGSDTSCGRGESVRVEVDGTPRRLRGAGPYVVAVPSEASAADLVMKANGITQRISLLTGKAAPGNIQVLGRTDRELHLNRRFDVSQSTSIRIYYIDGHDGSYQHTLNVTVKEAQLDYFLAGQTPRDPRHAFLFVNSWYTHQEDPEKQHHRWAFDESVLTFVGRDGTRYPARDLTEHKSYATQVFEVPASLTGGRLVIGGPRWIPQTADDGTPYSMRIAQHLERFAF